MSDVTAPISATTIASSQSAHIEVPPTVLFCGIGLIVTLVAVVFGSQGIWF
jgi:hypothetical protein